MLKPPLYCSNNNNISRDWGHQSLLQIQIFGKIKTNTKTIKPTMKLRIYLKLLKITHSLCHIVKECIQKQQIYWIQHEEFLGFPVSNWHKNMRQENTWLSILFGGEVWKCWQMLAVDNRVFLSYSLPTAFSSDEIKINRAMMPWVTHLNKKMRPNVNQRSLFAHTW